MKIALFSDSYYPYISGVTRAVATARKTLTNLGHEVMVFCPDYPDASEEPGVVRFPSVKAPTHSDYYVAISFLPDIKKTVAEFQPEIIHIHSPFNLGRMGFRVGRHAGIPVVFTYHTMYNMYSHYIPVLGPKISKAVENAAFRVARSVDAVITPSATIAKYLFEQGAVTNAIPIPNGIPISDFQGGDPLYLHKVYGVPAGVPIVLTCGRLGLEKNLEVLLSSFAIVRKRTAANLVLVGNGPLKEALQDKAKELGIEQSTYFLGSIPPDAMPGVYASGSVFLFTSLTDTQGLVLAEAKAVGLPAVAVGALGVRDMVKDGIDGFLCENDPAQLAERTEALLSDRSLLSAMSHNARREAQAFSKETCAVKLLECYRSVISP